MPKVLNFGSMNVDIVYDVPHFVRPEETLAALGRAVFCGGKGLNQSIALGRAGAEVYHAGAIGDDGELLIDALKKSGVDVSLVRRRAGPSGHAVIQCDADGQNCILLYGGANQSITSNEIDEAVSRFAAGDYIVLQNEINRVDEIIHRAKKQGMRVVFNPSPMDNAVLQYPLDMVDIFMLNEVEASDICGKTEPLDMLKALEMRYPKAEFVLTLGKRGAMYTGPAYDTPFVQEAYNVDVVDTTAAGDTFTGYFISSLVKGESVNEALRVASVAASLAVSRHGAEPSIPYFDELKL